MQAAMVLPPGLESTYGTHAQKAEGCEDLVQQIRRAVVSEMDAIMEENLQNIWQQGEDAAQQFSSQCRSAQDDLSEKLAELREQETMRQLASKVSGQLADFGSNVSLNAAIASDIAYLQAATAPELYTSLESVSAMSPVSPVLSLDALTRTPSPTACVRQQTHGVPVSGSSVLDITGNFSKLPEVPAFPFAPQAPPRSLCLVDALGLDESPPASGGNDAFIFRIMLEKQEAVDFGVSTSSSQGGVLHIDGVLLGSPAEAWNQLCQSTGEAEKALQPGDTIVDVNGIGGDFQAMKLECEQKVSLRLMVVRSGSVTPQAGGSEASATPRPEATAFVPGSGLASIVYHL